MILGIDASNLRAGGGLTHLAELLRAARPDAFGFERVVVWSGRRTLDALPTSPWLTLAHSPLLDGPLPARVLWQRAHLPRLARDIDVLLSPAGTAPASLHPQVVISQNMLPFDPKERGRYGASWPHARLLALRAVHGRAFSHADGVIFLTEFARDRICVALGDARPRETAIVPHGVDARFRAAPRPQRPLAACSFDAPLRLLYVSVISPYKHQWVVAEAVARLRSQGLPLAMSFVGAEENPPSMARLRAVMQQHDPGGTFLSLEGAVPFAEVHRRYQDAELFVFASSCENMPNILIEAMAAGLPIACSDRGPMPEVLRDAGAYFDPEDVDDTAASLRRLVEDHALRAQCAAKASALAEQFSWSRCADETLAFLAQTAARSPRR
ncbi:MAG: glycosyltransferase family 1 protein [Polyangiales bacterium]